MELKVHERRFVERVSSLLQVANPLHGVERKDSFNQPI
jgi:hypothetical protein